MQYGIMSFLSLSACLLASLRSVRGLGTRVNPHLSTFPAAGSRERVWAAVWLISFANVILLAPNIFFFPLIPDGVLSYMQCLVSILDLNQSFFPHPMVRLDLNQSFFPHLMVRKFISYSTQLTGFACGSCLSPFFISLSGAGLDLHA